MKLARRLALALIRAYQRWISPYKGFACAHRVRLGGPSCSKVGARLLRRHGLRKGLPLLRLRLRHCGEVHRKAWTPYRPLAAQRGDCDFDCGGCDLDVGDCADCSCDLADLFDFESRKKRRDGAR